MDTPRAAARKLSFWQIRQPPCSPRLIGRIAPGVGEDGGEQALAGDQTLAGAQQLAHEATFRACAVTEHGGHSDTGVLPDKRAGLGHGALAGIEFNLQELQLLALDLEIDVIGDVGVAVMNPGALCHGGGPQDVEGDAG
jgi:hypothetical protein